MCARKSGKNERILANIAVIPVEDRLGHGSLNTTSNTSPSSASKRGVTHTFASAGEANELFNNIITFTVHSTTCFEYNSGEIESRAFESGIIPRVFLSLSIELTWVFLLQVRGRERADDSDIDSEATTVPPKLEGDVPGTPFTRISRAEQAELLELWV